MNIEEAIKILEPETGSIEALSAAYLLKKNETGAEDAFNTLWESGETLVNEIIAKVSNGNGKKAREEAESQKEKNLATMNDIIDKIKHLEGIEAEICGSWLWVSGDTKQHANTLKSHGLKFAKKKVKWYWRPAGYKRGRGKIMPMEYIRNKYGSRKAVDEN